MATKEAENFSDEYWMRRALKLAAKGLGNTSPNPCVGAVVVRDGVQLGGGYHRQAGGAHAEVAAFADARKRGNKVLGGTLFVTLEPCSTTGRTPPCTRAIIEAGIKRLVVAAVDPNPLHAGRGLKILQRRGIEVESGVLSEAAAKLNESFNHWIVARTPFVVAKAAMTLDGKIATATGESKWITGSRAGKVAMRLRRESDAILVGVNTVLADDPALTVRSARADVSGGSPLRRIVLDTHGRTPLDAKVVTDEYREHTIIVVSRDAPLKRIAALEKQVTVWRAGTRQGRVSLRPLMKRLGKKNVTRLLVEGGGEVNGSFFDAGLVNRIAFFYAPKILGGSKARSGVAGTGVVRLADMPEVLDAKWRQLSEDLFLTGLIDQS